MPLETGILTTKLYRPRVSGDLEPRTRLVERLERNRVDGMDGGLGDGFDRVAPVERSALRA